MTDTIPCPICKVHPLCYAWRGGVIRLVCVYCGHEQPAPREGRAAIVEAVADVERAAAKLRGKGL